jgi:hypothetical protein
MHEAQDLIDTNIPNTDKRSFEDLATSEWQRKPFYPFPVEQEMGKNGLVLDVSGSASLEDKLSPPTFGRGKV